MKLIKYITASILFTLVIIMSISFLKKEKNILLVYPGGKYKALIMSYDDGPIEDIKLARLFDEYNITGTFNLNSGYLDSTRGWPQKDGSTVYQQYMPKDSMYVYKNHEIASHATYHKNFFTIPDDEVLEDVQSDMVNLEKLTHSKIKSMAYPFGNSDPHIAQLISHTGLTNARTIRDTYKFNLPDSFFLWNPTCHDSKALSLSDSYLSLSSNKLSVFYVWGHAWELRDKKRWDDMNTFCKRISNQKDIWYTGCGAFIDYLLALKQLKITKNHILNPKNNKEVLYTLDGLLKVLKPGESIEAKMS